MRIIYTTLLSKEGGERNTKVFEGAPLECVRDIDKQRSYPHFRPVPSRPLRITVEGSQADKRDYKNLMNIYYNYENPGSWMRSFEAKGTLIFIENFCEDSEDLVRA